MIGRKLAHFEITARLGEGGMGEVWQARDTRLNRQVAIKVLPRLLAGDPERRARMEREARVVASLAHPHICTLFELGEEDGTLFLAMELLEGKTLADRLTDGPLPLSEALLYGRQIADALERAHRAGIVHRDLKPSNVMLTRDGIKVLDFGLARFEPGAAPDNSALPTEQPLTGAHTVLGTLPYMAPEQLEGAGVDARCDVWALGAVLYEMAPGTGPSPARDGPA